MEIPFVCFFFGIDDVENEEAWAISSDSRERQEEALAIDFVYSLIRQLADQLPSKVMLQRQKFKTRIDRLNGSYNTIRTALRVLEELLEQAPASLLVIIDGLELVEDSEICSTITEVLLLLERMTIETRGNKMFKILYTTAGTSSALESLDEDLLENVEAEEGRPKHMKDRLRNLEDVSLDSDSATTSTLSTLTDDEQSD